MGYDVYEKSPDLGHPIRLVEFHFGGLRYHYTDHEEQIQWSGKTWFPIPIRHSALTDSASSDRQTVSFDMPADLAFAKMFFGDVSPWTVKARLYAGHVGDPDEEYILLFEGILKQASFRKQVFSASFETLQNLPGAVEGLRRPFGTLCPHTLYDQSCKVVKADHSVTAVPSDVSGAVLTMPSGWEGSFQKEHFLYGLVEWQDGDLSHAALIVKVDTNNDTLELAYAPSSIVAGTTELTLSKGCPKTSDECDARFSNILNFGGAITSPLNPPFGE